MKKILIMVLACTILFSALTPAFAAPNAKFTTQEAIDNYSKYMADYQNHDQKIVDQFRAANDGSFAHQLVERAVWYMENGYTVYGHVNKGYKDYGIVDCSNFTSLVYADAGYQITTASRAYDSVGQAVAGVTSAKVDGHYRIQGLENLRPGDIFTFWDTDTNGKRIIGHVAIYMGTFNGQPAIIGTTAKRPTALGVVNDFSYWYGEHFNDVRRVLPSSNTGDTMQAPVIPASYVLPPQKTVSMPGQAATKAQPAATTVKAAAPQATQPQTEAPGPQAAATQPTGTAAPSTPVDQATSWEQPTNAWQQPTWWQQYFPTWQANY